MPFGTSKTASYNDQEILKFPTGLHAIKSIVLDAKNWPTDPEASTSRFVVPAGTVLKFSATNPKQYVPYDGSGTIKGILAAPVDMVARATSAMEPAAMFFHECVFVTSALVGFTQYASAIVSTLNTCKFE